MASAIGWVNNITASATTFSNSSENAAWPQTNLGVPQGSAEYRTADGVKTVQFVINAGSAVIWDCASLHRTNLTSTAQVRIKIGAAATGGTYDSGVLTTVVDGQFVHVLPSAVTAQYLRYEVTDSSNPASYLSFGLAFGGDLFTPVSTFDTSSSFGRVSREEVVTSKSGQEFVTPYWQARTFMASYSGLTSADIVTVQDIACTAMTGGNFLIVPDLAGTPSRESVFGRLSISDIGYAAAGDTARSVKVTVKERI